MQIKFNAIKAAILAASLALSGVAFASQTYSPTVTADDDALVINMGGKNFNNSMAVGIPVIQLNNTLNAQDSFLAFCVEPTVGLQGHAVYTASQADVKNSVKALYETSYTAAMHDSVSQKAFQLALWELVADDGNIYDNGGVQYFLSGTNSSADAAFQMLDQASKHTVLSNMYTYTSFTGTGSNGSASQELLGVQMAAPVPEVSTWAMLGLGLGLIGFVGRRKSGQDQKFA